MVYKHMYIPLMNMNSKKCKEGVPAIHGAIFQVDKYNGLIIKMKYGSKADKDYKFQGEINPATPAAFF